MQAFEDFTKNKNFVSKNLTMVEYEKILSIKHSWVINDSIIHYILVDQNEDLISAMM